MLTYYYHLRRDTLRVKVGDTITRGQLLGLEGSSGYSTGSHIHFAVTYNNLPVETYLDKSTFWMDAPDWIMSKRSLVVGGISNYDFVNHLDEGPSLINQFAVAGGQAVFVWAAYTGVRQGDAIRAIYKRPDGTVHSNIVFNATQNWATSFWYFVSTLPTSPAPGTWSVDLSVGGEQLKTYTFDVTSVGVPEIRVEEFDATRIVLDERSTPYDFGSPVVGAASPTQTFRVVNHGNAPLTIQSLQVPQGFVVTEGLPTSIAAASQIHLRSACPHPPQATKPARYGS